jgi:hypothetical protein
MKKTSILSLLFIVAATMSALAQGNGAAGIQAATQQINSYFAPATTLMYSAGALSGLVGGYKVYSKYSSGEPDAMKAGSAWFGACIVLVVVPTVLRAFFLS